MKLSKSLKNKKLVVFDLDGTLNESKRPVKSDMAKLLARLLKEKYVAVISGGAYPQFQKQLLARFHAPKELLHKMFLFPTCSTAFYRYRNGPASTRGGSSATTRRDGSTRGGWGKVYAWHLPLASRQKIKRAFIRAFADIGYKHPKKVYGQIVEDRLSQITFSAVGQKAPVSVKEHWNKTQDARPAIMRALKKYIPEFEIRRGGLTSIDVTKKGIDKAYGVRQIQKRMGIAIKDMMFVGDAMYPGGNDHAALKTGITGVQVEGPREAKKVIAFLLQK